MTAGKTTADEEDEDPLAEFAPPEPAWQTGTALDEFLPIYKALAMTTGRHGALSPVDVDLMDISTVALLLGVDAGAASLPAIHAQWADDYDAVVATLGPARV